MERIDKILVSQNFGSRREVQKLIKNSMVKIDGKICRESDYKTDPETSEIKVNGQAVSYKKNIYIMLNKPSGVLSASRDKNAKTVLDLIPNEYKRKGLFPAGRLDKDTQGLLIITDDGDFAHRMLSPKKHVEKKYFAVLDNEITDDTIKAFEKGIVFADGTKCRSAKLEYDDQNNKKCGIVTICEGKFHQVKKMFSCCGINVVQLKRISIGKLYLDSKLPIGKCKLMSNLDKQLIFIGNIH